MYCVSVASTQHGSEVHCPMEIGVKCPIFKVALRRNAATGKVKVFFLEKKILT